MKTYSDGVFGRLLAAFGSRRSPLVAKLPFESRHRLRLVAEIGSKGLLFRMGICLAVFGCCLYSYLDTQNQATHLKIRLPEVEKEIKLIQEENRRLAYQIDQFESPAHLIELAHRPEYAHLRHPLLKEILTVPEALATN